MSDGYALAHLNVARMKAPYGDPLFADFVSRLDAVNAIADRSPGFIWRLVDETGEGGPDPFGDPGLLTNLSLWRDVESLRAYVHGVAHGGVMSRRAKWFERSEVASYVLWWIPSGRRPTLLEGKERLELLQRAGPGVQAFTFARHFAPQAT